MTETAPSRPREPEPESLFTRVVKVGAGAGAACPRAKQTHPPHPRTHLPPPSAWVVSATLPATSRLPPLPSCAQAYTYVAIWIALSGVVIMFNKYLLAYRGFPYPISLTMWHMFFCASLAILLVRTGVVSSISMDRETYIK